MKGKRILLSAILIAIIGILMFGTNTYAATDRNIRLDAVRIREGKNREIWETLDGSGNVISTEEQETNVTRYAYKMATTNGQKSVLKIVEKTGNGANDYNYNNAIYCLKAGVGFGSEDTIIPVIYNEYYDMVKEMATVNGKLMLSNDDYNSILWLLDNIYLPKQDSILKRKALLEKAFEGHIDPNDINAEWSYVSDLCLTDDDIEVVQQWALWHFTNKNDCWGEDLDTIWVSDGNSPYTSLPVIDTDEETTRQEEARILYKYLVQEAAMHTTYQPQTATEISITKNNIGIKQGVDTKKFETYYEIGPFRLEQQGNSDYELEAVVVDQNETVLDYTVPKNPFGTEIYRSIKEAVGEGDIYIRVPKNDSIESIKFTIKCKSNSTKSTFWTANNVNPVQPVVIIDRTPAKNEDYFEVKIPTFDLALRKNIASVWRNGTNISTTNLSEASEKVYVGGRTPNYKPLSNLKPNGTADTATYKHRKDPVKVQTGDIVEYVITIYNEGEVDGRATKVIDYLPEGLKLANVSDKIVSTNYSYNSTESTDRIIVLNRNNNNNLPAFVVNGVAKTDLPKEEIRIKCEVTANVPKGTTTKLTNYAEIAEAVSEGNFDDRDSTPGSPAKPSDLELPDYKGNGNKDNLTDDNYFYKGKQDDDDFEKLIVTTPQFDLALRKYITKVTRGTEVLSIAELGGRIPSIDPGPLSSGSNTAIYKHRKDPVPVQTGDIVEYTITVYNEGDIAGRATAIVDQLPDGLKYIGNEYKPGENSNNNYDFNYDSTTNRVTITAKSGYKNNLKAYEGEAKPASETITLLCEVTKKEDKTIEGDTILTNIAEIVEAYNYKDEKMYLLGDDRDSEPGNAIVPTGVGLSKYPEGYIEYRKDGSVIGLEHSDFFYYGQQDDDDFEKLKVTTLEYDLALRKYITHINGVAVDKPGMTEYDKREPTYHTDPLQAYLNGDKRNENMTAVYNHSKEPLVVKPGDVIRYRIRVYNEGSTDGHVGSIQDYLPPELEFVPPALSDTDNDPNRSQINREYNWQGTDRLIHTEALAGEIIKAYDPETNPDYLDSQYVDIECRVKDDTESGKKLTNIAAIKLDDGDDRDSDPNKEPTIDDTKLPDYVGIDIDHEDDDDYEKVVVYKPGYDLALRKFITKVIDGETKNEISIETDTTKDVTRVPVPTKVGGSIQYIHPKDPVIVKPGDRVIYTIRIYNEGEIDGTATSIEDYLPEELTLMLPALSKTDNDPNRSQINLEYNWQGTGTSITTSYLADKNLIIPAYNGADDVKDKNNLHYEDVQVECIVNSNVKPGKILTNIAQIYEDDGDDRDSQPRNVTKPNDSELPNYAEHQQDDDDYEKVKIYQPKYDLALRKFITEVNGVEIEDENTPIKDSRIPRPKIITTPQGKKDIVYEHNKEPLIVKNGDIVVYTIRVYNEGEVDGYAEEIKDNIPEGLAYIVDNDINQYYRWELSDDLKTVSTKILSEEVDSEKNLIKAFDMETMDVEKLSSQSKYVKIAFKVVEPDTSTRILKNIAEIKEDSGDDIDSTPNNNKDDEDDIDVEYVKLRYFDLALKKFITKVESKNGENLPIETDTTKDVSRAPEKVEIDDKGNIKYIMPSKDPVIVANSDVVIYTIRVFNEGTIDGYAEEIKDDVPVGLELVLDHEINNKYDWKMYDADGNVTNDVTKAKTIRTTYLSEENGKNNIIKAFDRETMSMPDFKDVQVAFKVVEKNVGEERIVINTAEISKDSDDDIDSTPDNDEPDEDDIDKEYIKLKYFDLSLLKWVSKVSVTRNGKTETTETGYNGLEDPEPLVKTEIKSSEIKTIVVKYEYGIKITNEGQIPGYAKEVADYIPAGLQFIPEDNPLWTVKEDGKIVTTQLEDTLLQPGESAIITVVFKWINNENNFGEKVNVAEISKDYNEKEAEDIDSTPDNKVSGEDDIDIARVILNPKTGGPIVYILLPTAVLSIISTGVILIKKYVI